MLAKLTRRPIKVEGLELDRYEFEGKSYFLLEDMVWLLGDTARRCNVLVPKIQATRYSIRLAVEGKGQYTRRLMTTDGVLLLCSASARPVAKAIYYALGAERDKEKGLPPREAPVLPPLPELPAKLADVYECNGGPVPRYTYKGLVYILLKDLEAVAGTTTARYTRRDAALMQPPQRIHLRLTDSMMRHRRTLCDLKTCRSLLMQIGTQACGELWTLINAEIESARTAPEESPHG